MRESVMAELKVVVAGQGAEPDAAATVFETGEREPGEIDEQIGCREAEAQHRDEALATGERASLATARERLERLIDALGTRVVERARIHLRRPTPRRRRRRGR